MLHSHKRKSALVIRLSALSTLAGFSALTVLTLVAIACDDKAQPPPQDSTSTVDRSPMSARGTFVITRTNASIGGSSAGAFGRVEATLFDVEGNARGTGSTTVRDGSWELQLYDEAEDVETYPMPRERVEIRQLDTEVGTPTSVTFEVPELTYNFDADAGIVSGKVDRSAEGWGAEGIASAEIVIGRPEIATASAGVEEDGSFSIDIGESAGAGSSSAAISVVSGDGSIRFVEDRRVPYVRVSLRPGDVTGAMAPLSNVELELLGEDGAPRGHGRALSGPDGRFEAWMRDASGERVRPRAGDRIIVGDGRDRRDWVLPEMVGSLDPVSGDLVGRGSPGNEIAILMWNPWHRGADGEPFTVVNADGTWSAQPPSPIEVATHYYITERFPEGDELYLCYQIPMLHAEPGSAAVWVEALWEVQADLSLQRHGEVIATAVGGGPWSGELELIFEDAGGSQVAVAAGDTIDGTLDGEPVSFSVAALEATIDPDGMFVGSGPAGAEVGAATRSPIGEPVTLGDDGLFSLDAVGRTTGGSARPGDRLSVFTLNESGHATHRSFVGPSLEVRLDRPIISGALDPRGPAATLAHVGADGTSTAMQVEADVYGLFQATIDRPVVVPDYGNGEASSATADPAGGDGGERGALERFELSQAGATTAVTIPVFSAVVGQDQESLVGVGPPYGIVDVKVWIGSSVMPEALATFIKEDGTWKVAFGSGTPGRFTYQFGDVSRFEVGLLLGPNALRMDLPGGLAAER